MPNRAIIVLLLALGSFLIRVYTVQADLTGSSFVNLTMEPIPCTLIGEIKLDTPCEKTLLKFDIESIVDVSFSASGLTFTLRSAMGIPGLEHLILTGLATLGNIDLTAELWMATPFESVTDVNLMPNTVVIPPGRLLFVKQRLTTEIAVGGVTIKNLALFEDVTFPNPGTAYGETDCDGDGFPEGTCLAGVETNPANFYQTQSFAFGDLITMTGQTPSGITVTSQLGICATNAGNAVKKYSASGRVNPDCAAWWIKPRLLFDFMSVSIAGIPLASSVIASANMNCVQVTACHLTSTLSFSGGPIPISVSLIFMDLFKVSFGGANIQIPAGPLTIGLTIDNSFTFTTTRFAFTQLLTAGNLSARLSANGSFAKDKGLTGMMFSLGITNGTFSSNHALQLVHNSDRGGLVFGSFKLAMGITIAPARVSLQAAFGQAGLARAGFRIGLVF